MSISPVTMTSAAGVTDPQPQTQASSGATPSAPSTTQPARNQNASQPEPSIEQLRQAVNQINENIQSVNKDVQFSIDHQSGRVVVKVVDTQNNQVIRQIPSKETLAVAEALGKLQGLIIHQKV